MLKPGLNERVVVLEMDIDCILKHLKFVFIFSPCIFILTYMNKMLIYTMYQTDFVVSNSKVFIQLFPYF